MKNIFKVLAITFAALIGFSFFACGGVDDGTSGTGTAPTITTASLPSGTVGTPYSQTLAATGTTPITWSVESGALPAGLDIAATGVISGTPTTADTFTFTVKAANAAGNGTKQLSITIANAGTTFVAVTSITDVPTTVVTNEELILTGTVNPSNATNKTIAWTIKDQGGTSSTLTEDILTATNSGTVKVTATITNGLTETTNYTQDFDINITQFTGTTYTVTFKNWNNETLKTQTVNEGSHATAPDNPTREGYTFTGWDKTFTNVTSNLTVTAQWTPVYTITYKDVGDTAFSGTNSSSLPTTHTYGTATTLVAPTKTDYIFGGWFTNSDGTGSAITSLSATGYTANITLYAKWKSGNFYYGVLSQAFVTQLKTVDFNSLPQPVINGVNALAVDTINKTTLNPKTVLFNTGSNGLILVMVPRENGPLKYLKDAGGVDQLASNAFIRADVSFYGIDYYLYHDNSPSSPSAIPINMVLEY